MAYLRLIWHYYDTEKPLENDPESLAFKIGSNSSDVNLILKHYFILDGDCWRKTRCDNVIAEYHGKADKARKSAEARWKNADAMRTDSERNANASQNNANASKSDANQEPITKNQEPIINNYPSDSVPLQKVAELFNDSFPELPKVKQLTDKRKTAVRRRWLENPDMQDLDRWSKFFAYCRLSDFLMGRTVNPWNGFCFDWLFTSSNFIKIREGNYHK
jgi:uncharacterized protein YdaU (DUF1376 family)